VKTKIISYKRVKNLGNYENETLELTAEIEEWEDPDEAVSVLQARVNSSLGLSDAVKKLENRHDELMTELLQLDRITEAARLKWQKVSAFMGKLGIPLETASCDDDIPF